MPQAHNQLWHHALEYSTNGHSDTGLSEATTVGQLFSCCEILTMKVKRAFLVPHPITATHSLLARWFVLGVYDWINSKKHGFPEKDECKHLTLSRSISS